MDSRLIPPLSTLKGFEAAARRLSHRAAAEELNLTHPAISHQIKNLEDHMGVKLFTRDGRNVVLSKEGKLFYPYVLEALQQLANGVSTVQRATKSSPLRIHTYVTFSIRWLARRLLSFRSDYPDINIYLATCAANWGFDEESSDIGIIYRETPPSENYHWVPLFDYRLFPVCTPQLMSKQDGEFKVEELLNLPLLSVETEFDHWEKWFRNAGVEVETVVPHMVVDTKAVALEMVLNNEGVALVNGPFVDDDLRSGRLIKPCNHEIVFPGGWGVICRSDIRNEPQIKCFIEWITKHAAQERRSDYYNGGVSN
jgi:LysR family glycine cleavage system transcriptional activator